MAGLEAERPKVPRSSFSRGIQSLSEVAAESQSRLCLAETGSLRKPYTKGGQQRAQQCLLILPLVLGPLCTLPVAAGLTPSLASPQCPGPLETFNLRCQPSHLGPTLSGQLLTLQDAPHCTTRFPGKQMMPAAILLHFYPPLCPSMTMPSASLLTRIPSPSNRALVRACGSSRGPSRPLGCTVETLHEYRQNMQCNYNAPQLPARRCAATTEAQGTQLAQGACLRGGVHSTAVSRDRK